jgi:phosphopantetheinyl transferase (holo-ACP synthase)
MICIGNDIVHLTSEWAQAKVQDQRFLSRVFTDEEMRSIQRSEDRVLALWTHWAAKEILYKIELKMVPHQRKPFVPRRYECKRHWISKKRSHISVYSGAFHAQGVCFSTPWYVHGIGWSCAAGSEITYDICHAVEKRVSEDVREESKNVRDLALRMFGDMAFPTVRIETSDIGRVRGIPIVVDAASGTIVADISLSHDDDYIAVAIGRAVR